MMNQLYLIVGVVVFIVGLKKKHFSSLWISIRKPNTKTERENKKTKANNHNTKQKYKKKKQRTSIYIIQAAILSVNVVKLPMKMSL